VENYQAVQQSKERSNLAYRFEGITKSILKEMWWEACDKGESLRFKIVSGSMKPLIMPGDEVKVAKTEPSDIRIGDVVALKAGQRVVVHRIIGKSLSNQQIVFRHMGDAGVSSAIIAAQNLIGKVSVIKKDGCEMSLDKSWYGVVNKIRVWRLRLVDSLSKTQPSNISIGQRFVLRLARRLFRSLLLRRI